MVCTFYELSQHYSGMHHTTLYTDCKLSYTCTRNIRKISRAHNTGRSDRHWKSAQFPIFPALGDVINQGDAVILNKFCGRKEAIMVDKGPFTNNIS